MPENKSEKKDYTLTLDAAGHLMGKSARTVQRYVKAGRLTQMYVMGSKGKEARLSKAEVLDLAKSLSIGIGAVPGQPGGAQTRVGAEQVNLNIMDLLKRHEQAMYRLGQLEEKSKNIVAIEEKAQSLSQKDIVQQNKIILLEHKLEQLERPLGFWERLSGKRRA